MVRLSNPSNTMVVFCGGGSNLLLESFTDAILKEYNIKILTPLENTYRDLIGVILLSGNDTIETTKIVPVEDATAVKSNYERFVELNENGFEIKEILTITRLSLQTLRNYQVKYNKEIQAV